MFAVVLFESRNQWASLASQPGGTCAFPFVPPYATLYDGFGKPDPGLKTLAEAKARVEVWVDKNKPTRFKAYVIDLEKDKIVVTTGELNVPSLKWKALK